MRCGDGGVYQRPLPRPVRRALVHAHDRGRSVRAGTRFGEPWPAAGTQQAAPAATDYRYTGQRSFEASLGSLYHYQARWYSPVLARFLSPDPIVPEPGNPQALNRYSYVYNNPLIYIDPTGLRKEHYRKPGAHSSDDILYGTYHDGSWHEVSVVAPGSTVHNIGGGLLVSCDEGGCTVWSERYSSRDGGTWILTNEGPLDGIIAVGKKVVGVLIGAEEQAPSCRKAGVNVCYVYSPVGNQLMSVPGWGWPGGTPGNAGRAVPMRGKPTRFIGGVTVENRGHPPVTGLRDLGPSIRRILSGKRYPHSRDGTRYENRSGALDLHPEDEYYYREYVVEPLPGVKSPGAERIVIGRGGEWFYSPDHYKNFIPLNQRRAMSYNICVIQFQREASQWNSEEALVAHIPASVQSVDHLMRVIDDQLQFPYFGFNWDALDEVLGDLEWITQRKVVIRHDGLPIGLTEQELCIYLKILIGAVEYWRSDEAAETSRELDLAMHELEVIFPAECRAEIERLLQEETR